MNAMGCACWGGVLFPKRTCDKGAPKQRTLHVSQNSLRTLDQEGIPQSLYGQVRANRPVSTRPRRPCPLSFALQSPISKNQWSLCILTLKKVGMARRCRPTLAPDLPSRSRAARRLEAPLYPTDGASRLMCGTPAARRPYLFNDLV